MSKWGILPRVIKRLVERRREVKKIVKALGELIAGAGDAEDEAAAVWYEESLVPFAKSEIVDLCLWRRYVGSTLGGLHSSRMYRENMRRREMEGYMKQFGKSFAEMALDKNASSVLRDDFALEIADMDE